jgi:hypothetical protein
VASQEGLSSTEIIYYSMTFVTVGLFGNKDVNKIKGI